MFRHMKKTGIRSVIACLITTALFVTQFTYSAQAGTPREAPEQTPINSLYNSLGVENEVVKDEWILPGNHHMYVNPYSGNLTDQMDVSFGGTLSLVLSYNLQSEETSEFGSKVVSNYSMYVKPLEDGTYRYMDRSGTYFTFLNNGNNQRLTDEKGRILVYHADGYEIYGENETLRFNSQGKLTQIITQTEGASKSIQVEYNQDGLLYRVGNMDGNYTFWYEKDPEYEWRINGGEYRSGSTVVRTYTVTYHDLDNILRYVGADKGTSPNCFFYYDRRWDQIGTSGIVIRYDRESRQVKSIFTGGAEDYEETNWSYIYNGSHTSRRNPDGTYLDRYFDEVGQEIPATNKILNLAAAAQPNGDIIFEVEYQPSAGEPTLELRDSSGALGQFTKTGEDTYTYLYQNALDSLTTRRVFTVKAFDPLTLYDQATIEVVPVFFDSNSTASAEDGGKETPYRDLYGQVRPEIIRQFSTSSAPNPSANEYKNLLIICAPGLHTGKTQLLKEINLDQKTAYNDNCSMTFLSRLLPGEELPERGAAPGAAYFKFVGEQTVNGNTICEGKDTFIGFSYAGKSNIVVKNLKLDGYFSGTVFRRYVSSYPNFVYPLNSNNTVDHVTMLNMGLMIGKEEGKPQYGKPTFTESKAGMFHSIYSTQNTLTNCIFDNSQILENDPSVNSSPQEGTHHYHGLYSSKLSDSLIENNYFHSIHADAIRLRDNCNRNVIRKNDILNSGKETACSEYESFSDDLGIYIDENGKLQVKLPERLSYGNEFYRNKIGNNFYGEPIRYGVASYLVGVGYEGHRGPYDRGSDGFLSHDNFWYRPIISAQQILGTNADAVQYEVITHGQGGYDQIKAMIGDRVVAISSEYTSYWEKGEEYYKWNISLPAPNQETQYTFDVRAVPAEGQPGYYLNDNHQSEPVRYLSVSHTINKDGNISFQIVTVSDSSYRRVAVYQGSDTIGYHTMGASTPVGRDENGNYVWTVKTKGGALIPKPSQTTTYRLDIVSGNAFLRTQVFYTVTV